MDDAPLIDRCRSGDPLAWEALVRRYQGRVYGLALHYLGDAEEARDAAQEVFVKVYRELERAGSPDRFLPWLIRVTRNTCLDEHRRRRRRVRVVDLDEGLGVAAEDPTPEETWQSKRQIDLLKRAMADLGERSREILSLQWIAGISVREAAAVLRIPVGTAKSRLNRARAELVRRVLELEGEER